MPKGGTITVAATRDNGIGVDNTKLGGAGEKVARELEKLTGLESRCTVLRIYAKRRNSNSIW